MSITSPASLSCKLNGLDQPPALPSQGRETAANGMRARRHFRSASARDRHERLNHHLLYWHGWLTLDVCSRCIALRSWR